MKIILDAHDNAFSQRIVKLYTQQIKSTPGIWNELNKLFIELGLIDTHVEYPNILHISEEELLILKLML